MAITWNNTIRQQFRGIDVTHMKQVTGNNLKLDDFNSVRTAAGEIWDQVSNNHMPPGKPWSTEFKENFKTWMENGMPEGDAQASTGGGAASGAGAGGGSGGVTWTNTIKNQFKPFDIDHMKQVSGGDIDLSDFASTKRKADDIYAQVSSQQMPPGNPWSEQFIKNFKAWMDAGYPKG